MLPAKNSDIRSANVESKSNSEAYQGKVKAWLYDMKDHSKQCVERYLELAKKTAKSLQKRQTPCIDDHQLDPDDFTTKGTLESVASRIVLKILYTARIGRPDILWSVNTLARMITKWNRACDKRRHRLVSHLHSTRYNILEGFVDGDPNGRDVIVYSDASFADDTNSSKSTSASFVALVGPNALAPITAICKKQTVVSHFSTESDIVALDTATRAEALPMLSYAEAVCDAFASARSERGGGRCLPSRGRPGATQATARALVRVPLLLASLPQKTTKRPSIYWQRVEHPSCVARTCLIALVSIGWWRCT